MFKIICLKNLKKKNRLVELKNGKKVNFHLYDSMGQEKYRMLTSTFYSKANLVFLVFDVAQRESFENLKNWVVEAQRYNVNNASILLLGNKTDLQRVVTTVEGKERGQEYSLNYFELSALTGQNVNETFIQAAEDLINLI